MRAIRLIVSIHLLAAAAGPAGAEWPPNGAPVCVAPGSQWPQSVVPDRAEGVFVAWGFEYKQVAVQRMLVTGAIAPGWPAFGFVPGGIPNSERTNARVVPDGSGGCYFAWKELLYGSTYHMNYVRLLRLTPTGGRAPGWPEDGLVIAEGRISDIGLYVTLEMLTSTSEGCLVVFSYSSSGCHDGICGSGGSVSFQHVTGNGVPFLRAYVEPECRLATPEVSAISDGRSGLFALAHSKCVGYSTLRHVQTGSEPATALPVSVFPGAIVLTSGGNITAISDPLATFSYDPTWFHWKPDGTPAAGSPVLGVPLPGGWAQTSVLGPGGSTIYCWRPSGTSPDLRAIRLEPDGMITSVWSPPGVLLASLVTPRHESNFGACADGQGGVIAAWSDQRDRFRGRDIYSTRVLANGSVHAGTPAGGSPVCEAAGEQYAPMVVALGPGLAIAVWADARSGDATDIYAQIPRYDTPLPATASLARAEARPDRVSLEWRFSEAVSEVVLERSRDGNEWSEFARLVPGSQGSVAYEDTDVRPGEALAYRIHFQSGERQAWTVPVWVEVPRAELAMRVLPAATRDRLSLEVTLASDEPAQLDLLDVKGRRLRSHDVSRLGTSPMRLELELRDLAPGIAWLRLRQGRDFRTLRLAITR